MAFDDNERKWVAVEVPKDKRTIYKQVRGKPGMYHVKKVLMAYVKHDCPKFGRNAAEQSQPDQQHFSEPPETEIVMGGPG